MSAAPGLGSQYRPCSGIYRRGRVSRPISLKKTPTRVKTPKNKTSSRMRETIRPNGMVRTMPSRRRAGCRAPKPGPHSRLPANSWQRAELHAGGPAEVFPAGQAIEDEEAKPGKLPHGAARSKPAHVHLWDTLESTAAILRYGAAMRRYQE